MKPFNLFCNKKFAFIVVGIVCCVAGGCRFEVAANLDLNDGSSRLNEIFINETDYDNGFGEEVAEALPPTNAELTELEVGEFELAAFVSKVLLQEMLADKIIAEAYDEAEIERIARNNAQKINSSFLVEYKNKVSSDDYIVNYFEDLNKWRNFGESSLILTQEQLSTLKLNLNNKISKFKAEGFKLKEAFPRTIDLLKNLFSAAKKGNKIELESIQQIESFCKQYEDAMSRFEKAVSSSKGKRVFGYAALSKGVFKLFCSNFGEAVAQEIFTEFEFPKVLVKINEFCKIAHEFYKSSLKGESSKFEFKLEGLNKGFAAFKPYMANIISVVNTLLTPIDSIDLKMVDKTKQKELHDFLTEFKKNNRSKAVPDDRTFLDLSLYYYVFICKTADAGGEIRKLLVKHFKQSIGKGLANASFDELKIEDKTADALARTKFESLFSYFLALDNAYFTRKKKITINKDVDRKVPFSDTGSASEKLKDKFFKEDGNKLEDLRIFSNLAVGLLSEKDGFNKKKEIGINFDRIISLLKKLKSDGNQTIDKDFVEALKKSKDFFVKLLGTLSKFDISADGFEKNYGEWLKELEDFFNNLKEDDLAFLAYKPGFDFSKLISLDYGSTRKLAQLTQLSDGALVKVRVEDYFKKERQIIGNLKDTVDKVVSFKESVKSFLGCVSVLREHGQEAYEKLIGDKDFYKTLQGVFNGGVFLENAQALVKQREEIDEELDENTPGSLVKALSGINIKVDFLDIYKKALGGAFFYDFGEYTKKFSTNLIDGVDYFEVSPNLFMNYMYFDPQFSTRGADDNKEKPILKTPAVLDFDVNLVGGKEYQGLPKLISSLANDIPIVSAYSYGDLKEDVFLQAMNVLAATNDGIKTVDELKKVYASVKDVEVNVTNGVNAPYFTKVESFYTDYADYFAEKDKKKIHIGVDYTEIEELGKIGDVPKTFDAELKNEFKRQFDSINEANEGFAEDRAKAERIRLRNEFDRQRRKRLKKNKEQELLQKQKISLDALVDVVNEVTDKYNLLYKNNVVSNQKMSEVANLLSRESEVNSQTGANEGNVIYLDQSMTDALDVDNLRFNYNDYKEEAKPKTSSYNIILDEFGDDLSTGLAYKSLSKVPAGLGMLKPSTVEAIEKGYF